MKYPVIVSFVLLTTADAISQETEKVVPPGWWQIPKTEAMITVGGYVKFDLIQDFNPIASPNFFDISKIPTDDSKGTNTRLQANETRLFLDFKMPAGKFHLRTYVEGDFYGTGNAFRLRHAYIEISERLLAGQTWSNFMDENIIPPTLDFEKPLAYALLRHGMIRYKQPLGVHSYIAVALEDPLVDVQEPARSGKSENFLPDLTARYRYTNTWGHIQLSAFGALVRFRPANNGSTESTALYGVNLSGQINLHKKDYFIYQFVTGPGVSRYRGGKYAAPDDNDNLEAIRGVGLSAGVKHFWSPEVFTLLFANYGTEDNTSAQPGSDIESVLYGSATVIWQFHKSVFAGIEYLHGGRKDKNGADGRANRIQLSIRADINKH